MIKGIIFDCFGVLIASDLQMRIDAVAKVNPDAGKSLTDIVKAIDRGMLTRDEAIPEMAKLMGVDPEELLRGMTDSLVKNTDLTAFIRTLRPKYKVAMLSNVSGRDRLDQLFDLGELDELFDVVVASGDVGVIKPEPEIYQLTIEKLGIDPKDCVMIDDLESYCNGAEAVGIHAIQFTSTSQAVADLEALIDRENQTD
jgi:epoxide hydrolase-like predicted phosphatase